VPKRRLHLAAAAAIVCVVAAALVVSLYPGSSTPRHVDDWFVGSWRVTSPMIGVSHDALVARPAAPGGVVTVTRAKGGLLFAMTGFPGVSTKAVPAVSTPLGVHFETPDAGQGIGRWAMAIHTPTTAALAYYDPATDQWSRHTMLARQ